MPCLWDMRDPTFRDVDYVEQTVEKLRRIHQKIFGQRRMLSADDVFALVGDMQSNSEKAIFEANQKFGSPTDQAQYEKVCAYADNICCYATAMLYTAPARMHELQLIEGLKGPRMFKHPNGEIKSIRWLNGTTDEFQSMPLCLLKLKLSADILKYSEDLEARSQAKMKDRLEMMLFMKEGHFATELFKVMDMKDGQ